MTCCSLKFPRPRICNSQHPDCLSPHPNPPSHSAPPPLADCPIGSCSFFQDTSFIAPWRSLYDPSTLILPWQSESFSLLSYQQYLFYNICTFKKSLVLYVSSHMKGKPFQHVEHVLFVWILILRDSKWLINVFWVKWIWLWITRI